MVSVLLTKRQLARTLQVSPRTIDRWVQSGKIPESCRIQIGSVVRFRKDVTLNWIDTGCGRSDVPTHLSCKPSVDELD